MSTNVVQRRCPASCGRFVAVRTRLISDEAVGDGVGRHGRRRTKSELAHEVGAVLFHGLVAQGHQLCHLTRTVTARDQGDDFLLAVGERLRRPRPRSAVRAWALITRSRAGGLT